MSAGIEGSSSGVDVNTADPFILEFLVNLRWLLQFLSQHVDATLESHYPQLVANAQEVLRLLQRHSAATVTTLATVPLAALQIACEGAVYLLAAEAVLDDSPPSLHPFLLRAATTPMGGSSGGGSGGGCGSSPGGSLYGSTVPRDLNESNPSRSSHQSTVDARPVGQLRPHDEAFCPARLRVLEATHTQAMLLLVRWLASAQVVSPEELAATLQMSEVQKENLDRSSGGKRASNRREQEFTHQREMCRRLAQLAPFYLGAHVVLSRSLLLRRTATRLDVSSVERHIQQLLLPEGGRHPSPHPSSSITRNSSNVTMEASLAQWMREVIRLAGQRVANRPSTADRLSEGRAMWTPALFSALLSTVAADGSDFYHSLVSGTVLCMVLHYYHPALMPLHRISTSALAFGSVGHPFRSGTHHGHAAHPASPATRTGRTDELSSMYTVDVDGSQYGPLIDSQLRWQAVLRCASVLGLTPCMHADETALHCAGALQLHVLYFVTSLFAVLATESEEDRRVHAECVLEEQVLSYPDVSFISALDDTAGRDDPAATGRTLSALTRGDVTVERGRHELTCVSSRSTSSNDKRGGGDGYESRSTSSSFVAPSSVPCADERSASRSLTAPSSLRLERPRHHQQRQRQRQRQAVEEGEDLRWHVVPCMSSLTAPEHTGDDGGRGNDEAEEVDEGGIAGAVMTERSAASLRPMVSCAASTMSISPTAKRQRSKKATSAVVVAPATVHVPPEAPEPTSAHTPHATPLQTWEQAVELADVERFFIASLPTSANTSQQRRRLSSVSADAHRATPILSTVSPESSALRCGVAYSKALPTPPHEVNVLTFDEESEGLCVAAAAPMVVVRAQKRGRKVSDTPPSTGRLSQMKEGRSRTPPRVSPVQSRGAPAALPSAPATPRRSPSTTCSTSSWVVRETPAKGVQAAAVQEVPPSRSGSRSLVSTPTSSSSHSPSRSGSSAHTVVVVTPPERSYASVKKRDTRENSHEDVLEKEEETTTPIVSRTVAPDDNKDRKPSLRVSRIREFRAEPDEGNDASSCTSLAQRSVDSNSVSDVEVDVAALLPPSRSSSTGCVLSPLTAAVSHTPLQPALGTTTHQARQHEAAVSPKPADTPRTPTGQPASAVQKAKDAEISVHFGSPFRNGAPGDPTAAVTRATLPLPDRPNVADTSAFSDISQQHPHTPDRSWFSGYSPNPASSRGSPMPFSRPRVQRLLEEILSLDPTAAVRTQIGATAATAPGATTTATTTTAATTAMVEAMERQQRLVRMLAMQLGAGAPSNRSDYSMCSTPSRRNWAGSPASVELHRTMESMLGHREGDDSVWEGQRAELDRSSMADMHPSDGQASYFDWNE